MSKHTLLMLSALAAFAVGWICGGSRAVDAARETACAEACHPLDGVRQDGRCRCRYEMEPRESAR